MAQLGVVSLLDALLPGRLVLCELCIGGRAGGATDFGDAEDGLPALELADFVLVRRETETCGSEGALSPAIVDVGKVPVDGLGGGVAIELVAHVDKVLDGGDINVVDCSKIEDDGFESWTMVVRINLLAALWPWVVPWAVLEYRSEKKVRLTQQVVLTPGRG